MGAFVYAWILPVTFLFGISHGYFSGGRPPNYFPSPTCPPHSCRETIEDLKALIEITQCIKPDHPITCPTCTCALSEDLIVKLVNALIYTVTHGVIPVINGGNGGVNNGGNQGGIIGGGNTGIGGGGNIVNGGGSNGSSGGNSGISGGDGNTGIVVGGGNTILGETNVSNGGGNTGGKNTTGGGNTGGGNPGGGNSTQVNNGSVVSNSPQNNSAVTAINPTDQSGSLIPVNIGNILGTTNTVVDQANNEPGKGGSPTEGGGIKNVDSGNILSNNDLLNILSSKKETTTT